MCLIQRNSLTNAFEVDIEKNKTISKLKDVIKKKNVQTFSNIDAKDIKLWKDQGELLATKKISKYFPFTLPEENVHVTVKLSPSKANGDPPTKVLLWRDFFEEVNRFQFSQQPKFVKPQLDQNKVVFCEEDVRDAIDVK
ncbi:989_t:CDS:2 [Gigaspora margarita]|uniref:989_t:CDS:1 n=1 Tax=Gigaspora margarita TaxID=4874 RepID=A0ABN7UVK6_GIGMA|nr:989_t:CDS:2 [Gigaspora margarita]